MEIDTVVGLKEVHNEELLKKIINVILTIAI